MQCGGAQRSRAARRRPPLRRRAQEADVRLGPSRRLRRTPRQSASPHHVSAQRVRRAPSIRDASRSRVLAVTLGDVRGIGPEIVEKAAASREVRDAADLVFVGPAGAGSTSTKRRAVAAAESTPPTPDASPDARSSAPSRSRSRAKSTESSPRRSTRPRCSPAAIAIPGHTEMLATLTGRQRRDDACRDATGRWLDQSAARRARDDAPCAARRAGGRDAPRRSSTRRDVTRDGPSRLVRDRASRASRSARSIRTPATAGASATKTRSSCARPPKKPVSPGRFPPTRSSSARCAARSTPSSRRITTSE